MAAGRSEWLRYPPHLLLWGVVGSVVAMRCGAPTNNDTATQITIITVQSIAKSDDWERLSQ